MDFGSIEKGLEHLRKGDALTYADLELPMKDTGLLNNIGYGQLKNKFKIN